MLITKVVKQKTIVVKKIRCDVCKKTFNLEDSHDELYETQEFFHIKHCGGYGSIFGDGKTLSIDICQYCFKNILDKNLISY